MGNKLFLRELRRFTVDCELVVAILADCQNYRFSTCAARYHFFFPLVPRARFVRSHRDYIKSFLLYLIEVFQDRVAIFQNALCRSSYALVVLNPHHVTLLVRTWRPSSITFPSEAQSMSTFLPFCNASFHFQIRSFRFSADSAMQN